MVRSMLFLALLVVATAKFLPNKAHGPANNNVLDLVFGQYVNRALKGRENIDENGRPFTRCAHYANGKVTSKVCQLPEDADEEMGVACYALWHGNHVTQDCWIHQQLSLEQCQANKCEATGNAYGVHFCCCVGEDCNAHYAASK